MDNATPSNPKFQQFVDELNALLARYQFNIKPSLSFNGDGITPHLQVNENVPPKEDIVDATPVDNPDVPATETPVEPTPPQPEAPATPEPAPQDQPPTPVPEQPAPSPEAPPAQ